MAKTVMAQVIEPCMQHESPARINRGFPGIGPIRLDKSEAEAMEASAGILCYVSLRSKIYEMTIRTIVLLSDNTSY